MMDLWRDSRACLKWALNAFADRLDYAGILALVLAMLLAAILITVLWPLHAQLSRLENDIQTLQSDQTATSLSIASKAVGLIPSTNTSPLQAFHSFLPSSKDRNKHLKALHDWATAQHLAIVKAQYSSLPRTRLPVDGLLIRLEIQGEEPDLRRYLNKLLRGLPALAVRSLELSRDVDGSPPRLILELAMYYRLGEAANAP